MPRYLKLLSVLSCIAFGFSSSLSLAESELFETRLSEPAALQEAVKPNQETAKAVNKNVPKSILTQYEVSKNGQPFARVKEQFKLTGKQYHIESVTKGLGVYALMGERILTSKGDWDESGLKPQHFELHQGDNAKKTLLADFDWAKQSLQMTVKGKPKMATLLPGTQDLASFAYQFMFSDVLELKKSITLPVTTGKKLNQYQYKIEGEEHLEIDGKAYRTLHLVESDPDKTAAESKQFWLDMDHHFVPVRITMTEDGALLEQIVTGLQID